MSDELERATRCILCNRALEAYEPFIPLLAWAGGRRPGGRKAAGADTVAAHFACFVEVIARRTAELTDARDREGEQDEAEQEERDDFADTVSAVVRELFRR